jgi:hypothetical protein
VVQHTKGASEKTTDMVQMTHENGKGKAMESKSFEPPLHSIVRTWTDLPRRADGGEWSTSHSNCLRSLNTTVISTLSGPTKWIKTINFITEREATQILPCLYVLH